LTGSIENRTKYLQRHFGVLFRDSVVDSAVSKMPPKLQNFTGHLLKKDRKINYGPGIDTQDFSARKVAQGIVIGIAEAVPFFLKGKKGTVLAILMRQVVKWIR
jgi:hypothetical protein